MGYSAHVLYVLYLQFELQLFASHQNVQTQQGTELPLP